MSEGKIVLMRGIQCSGKTQESYMLQERNPNWVRISRDDIRRQLFGRMNGVNEELTTEVETAMVRAALRLGQTVIIDAMHLRQAYVNKWQRLGYPVEIVEVHNRLEELLERNQERNHWRHEEDVLPDSAIEKNFKKYTNKDGTLKKVKLNPEQYIIDYKFKGDVYAPTAVIVDMDGTLAHNDGHRSYYDYSNVAGDGVHWHVVDAVNGLGNLHHVIVVSGRPEEARQGTIDWLTTYGVQYDELLMRQAGDQRSDMIVKMEILRDVIAPQYNVIASIDDRPSVCEVWRKMGIPTFQVGDPDNRF